MFVFYLKSIYRKNVQTDPFLGRTAPVFSDMKAWVCHIVSQCVFVHHGECVRVVRASSCRGRARLVSLCHRGVLTWGGGVSTLWATPGVFSSDSNSSPRVTMATMSSSSLHQGTEPLFVMFLSLERNRDTLQRDRQTSPTGVLTGKNLKSFRAPTWGWGHVTAMPALPGRSSKWWWL